MSFNIDKINSKEIKHIQSTKDKEEKFNGYIVKSGETIYSLQKAFNFKNEREFREYVKMSGTQVLQKGAVLKVPTAKLETTIAALAKKYNMELEDLLKLNPQIKDPTKLKKGTLINVPKRPFEKPETIVPTIESINDNNEEKPLVDDMKFFEKEEEVIELVNPKKIASALEDAASDWGAINGKDFKNAFKLINKENIIEVIKEYDKISPKESLINMITSEITNGKQIRKDAVMKVYDTLAERVGGRIATPAKRQEFLKELNEEFDSWGMVSTKKMDKMIQKMIKEYSEPKSNTPITFKGKKTKFTVSSLHEDWQRTAKEWNRTKTRPMPKIDKDGNIIADVKIIEPTDDGPLSGKTIIVNPGHGGAICNPNSSVPLAFDPGTSNAQMKGNIESRSKAIGNNGKIVEEWEINEQLADELTERLTSEGAKVIYVSGSVYVAPKAIAKYRDNAEMVISLHCNSGGDEQGIFIIGTDTKRGKKRFEDTEDSELAETIAGNLNSQKEFKGITDTRTQGLAVLRDTNSVAYAGPDVLIEAGNLKNEKDVKNLTSKSFREKFINTINNSIQEYIDTKYKMSEISSLDDVAEFTGLSEDYIRHIKKSEDSAELGEDEFHTTPYHDKNGHLTIGIGHRIWPNEEKKYLNGDPLTNEEVCQLLAKDITERTRSLETVIGKECYNDLPQQLKDAVMDYTYNRGIGTIKRREGFVEALKEGCYDDAITKMDVDYTIVKDKSGILRKRYLTGLSKRRLFEMYLASQIYDGDIPSKVKKAVQNMYERGLMHMQKEFPNKKQREAVKVGYNQEVKEWFDFIKLR